MNCQQIHNWYSRDEMSETGVKEAMGLHCPYGNTEGIKFNDLASWPDPIVCVGALSLAV